MQAQIRIAGKTVSIPVNWVSAEQGTFQPPGEEVTPDITEGDSVHSPMEHVNGYYQWLEWSIDKLRVFYDGNLVRLFSMEPGKLHREIAS